MVDDIRYEPRLMALSLMRSASDLLRAANELLAAQSLDVAIAELTGEAPDDDLINAVRVIE